MSSLSLTCIYRPEESSGGASLVTFYISSIASFGFKVVLSIERLLFAATTVDKAVNQTRSDLISHFMRRKDDV
jgi:hypothetical protein